MIEKLGYPKSLIVIEKAVGAFGFSDTARRVDILCFRRGEEGLKPLLLIECKVESPSRAAEEQLLGYNQEIKAPFIALASQEGVKMFWREKGEWVSVPFLPPFSELIQQCPT